MHVRGSDPVLAVHDLASAAEWFDVVLGAVVTEVPGWRFCRVGEVTFRLGACPDALPPSELGDHSYIAYIHVDDVDALHDRAVRAGADILKAPTDEHWGRREVALRHPDGHRFMFGAAIG